MKTYFAGMSLGMGADYTALALVGREGAAEPEAAFECPHLERWPPGTPYGRIIEETRDKFSRIAEPPAPSPPPPEPARGRAGGRGRAVMDPFSVRYFRAMAEKMAAPALALDVTGTGLPVAEMFKKGLGIPPPRLTTIDLDDASPPRPNPPRLHPVFITAAEVPAIEPDATRIPKRELISVAQIAMQTGRLKIAPELPDASLLRKELANFRVNVRLGELKDSSELWREGANDGLVFALCLALWFASRVVGKQMAWSGMR